MVIIDEVHNWRSVSSSEGGTVEYTLYCNSIRKAAARILLSGTPTPNYYKEFAFQAAMLLNKPWFTLTSKTLLDTNIFKDNGKFKWYNEIASHCTFKRADKVAPLMINGATQIEYYYNKEHTIPKGYKPFVNFNTFQVQWWQDLNDILKDSNNYTSLSTTGNY